MGAYLNNVLPVDLYHSVPIPEFMLERALKIVHIHQGKEVELPRFETGTLFVLCTAGDFWCVVNKGEGHIQAGQVMLAAAESVEQIRPPATTAFEGVILFVSEAFLVNRQRLQIRPLTHQEQEESLTYIRLIEAQVETNREARSKVIESLLRALLISLQSDAREEKHTRDDIPPLLGELAALISRYHHSPAYFYAQKLGMSSPELNNRCLRYTQMTAAEWISGYVLLEAKDLLRKTRLRIAQVAELLCFANQDTFSRWFRRQTGEFPSEWNR